MSWIFGILGKHNNLLEKNFTNKNLLFSFHSDNLKIFAGGLKENVFYEKTSEASPANGGASGWAVCGVGIIPPGRDPFGKIYKFNYRFMDFDNWKEYLSKEGRNSEELNGHFIAVKWSNNEIIFFNDKLGIRELYILKEKTFTAFSTRLDFFSLLNHKFEINLGELCGYWLLSFPLSTNSLFTKIDRLGAGGEGKISKDVFIKNNNPVFFDFKDELKRDEYIENLNNITTFPLLQGKKVSLGLTGGLDSRVLLEMLLNANSKNWQTHFFGSKDLPDVKIAKQISLDKNIPSQHLYEPITTPENCLSLLKDCICQLGPVTPASAILFYPYYNALYKQGWVTIDGGHGEIHRRESLNRILYLAKNRIIKKDPVGLYKLFSLNKANIFNYETVMFMEKEAGNQVSNLFSLMPEPKDIGIENWLDLLMLRYPLSNSTGPSQSLLDSMSVAYMPYIQHRLLQISFALSVKKKKNGKIFRNILNNSNHQLNSYRLVKNSIYYPYNTGSFTKRLILAAKRKTGRYYKDKTNEVFLDIMKDYIFDTINSNSFNSYGYYDHKKIKQNVVEFYSGNKSVAGYLDWWLTFDIWRSIFIENK